MKCKLFFLLATIMLLVAAVGCNPVTEVPETFEGKVVKIFTANTSPDDRILFLQLDSGEHLAYLGSMPIHLNKRYTFLVDTSAGYGAYPFILSVRLLEEKACD